MKKIIFSLTLLLFTGCVFAQTGRIKFTARKNPANANQLQLYAKNVNSSTITGIIGSSNLTVCIAFPKIYSGGCIISSPIGGQSFDGIVFRSEAGEDSVYSWNGLGSTAEITFTAGIEVHIANVNFIAGFPRSATVKMYNAVNGGASGFDYNYIAPNGIEHCAYTNPFYSNIPGDPLLANAGGSNNAFTQGNSYLGVVTLTPEAPVLTVDNRCNGTSRITAKDEFGANIPVTELTWSNGGSGNPLIVSNTTPITATRAVNGYVSLASNTVTPAPNTPPTAAITNNTGTTVLNCTTTAINLTATGGATYVWDNELGSGATKTITSPSTYAVSVTSAAGCISQASIVITQDFSIPATPATVNGLTNICPYIGNNTQLTYSVDPDPVALTYQWILPANVVLISGQGTNSITVTLDAGFAGTASKLFKVRATSGCGSSAYKLFYLLAQTPGTPAQITASSTNVCTVLNTSNTISYTIPKVLAATSYIWTAQAGSTVITHPNGPGVNDTTVQLSFGPGFTSSTISVQSVNACGTSGLRTFNITRNNPPTPGIITGSTNVCANIAPGGVAAVYSISNATTGTSYDWTIPVGAIGFTGQGTNTISFTYPAGFTGGSISVTATNGCGTSGPRTLSVTKLNPATPGVIDVIQEQICPNRVYSYSLSSMPANARSVQWTVPTTAGVVIVSGQGTNSIHVSYPAEAIQGTVTAQAISNCAVSSIRQVAVRLPACPPPTFAGKAAITKNAKGNVADTKNAKENLRPEAPSPGFDVTVFPNPTTSDFNLIVKTGSQSKLTVRLFDVQGKQLKTFKITANEITRIGNDLQVGIYLLEITEGKNKSIKKLIKQ